MFSNKTIAVIVPAYNEENLIGETLHSVPSFVDRIYAIDDGSKDKTLEIIKSFTAQDSRIIPLTHPANRGVGGAIVTGYKKMFGDDIEIGVVMAGDNQMDPAFLPELITPVIEGRCDYTVGNRLISPEYRKGMTTWRFVGNAILTLLTKIASGYWQLMDPQNGYTAISKRALERISLDDIYPGYGYCNDLLVRLNVVGFRVKNVPHPARYGREKSGIRYSTYIIRLSCLLISDFLWRLKTKYVILSFHPLVLFYLLGSFFCLFSLVLGIYSLYFKYILLEPIFVPAALTLIALGIGMQCIFFAMLFDMQEERNSGEWY
jgi:glycosyltransferase involved in cell wall biosynthesis